jgi:hypothetical protein
VSNGDGETGCRDCRCWYLKPPTIQGLVNDLKGTEPLNLSSGECRRYPPSRDADGPPWPRAMADEWCGELRL